MAAASGVADTDEVSPESILADEEPSSESSASSSESESNSSAAVPMDVHQAEIGLFAEKGSLSLNPSDVARCAQKKAEAAYPPGPPLLDELF